MGLIVLASERGALVVVGGIAAVEYAAGVADVVTKGRAVVVVVIVMTVGVVEGSIGSGGTQPTLAVNVEYINN